MTKEIKSYSELSATLAATLCFLILYTLAWVILVDGGISIQIRRMIPLYVSGSLSMLINAGFFLLAFGFAAGVARILRLSNFAIGIKGILIFIPPIAYLFSK